jgi:hypothetical protein
MTPSFPAAKVALVLLVVALDAFTAAAATAPSVPTTRPATFKDKYAPISEHNIFLKDRRYVPPERRPGFGSGGGGSDTPRERIPEASFILTGVVIEEGQLRAYVEDSNAGKVLRLAVGDPVARGHIAEIEIDAVAYAGPGQPLWVNLGCDFRGVPIASIGGGGGSSGGGRSSTGYSGSASTTTPSGSGSTAAAAAPGAPADPNNPNLSIEEKMRLRRAQELQK